MLLVAGIVVGVVLRLQFMPVQRRTYAKVCIKNNLGNGFLSCDAIYVPVSR